MITFNRQRCLLGILFLGIWLLSVPVGASTPVWEIVPKESEIKFTGVQNNSPLTGSFKTFNGNIKGDIDQLEKSSVIITIDTNSLTLSYKDLEDTLKASDWFSTDVFPKATYTANQFKKIDDHHYQALGNLTIREQTLPLTVDITVDHYDNENAKVHGSTSIKRTAFGVGKGEWGSTEEIKDEVQINFVLTAIKKRP